MADIGRWTGGTTSLIPTTSSSAPNGLFPTEDRNDSSVYSFNSSTSTLTLPSSDLADGYLIVAAFEFEDTSNGRHNPQGELVRVAGGSVFRGGYTGGYNRDNSEDRSYVRCWAFADGPAATETIQFRWKRDSDAPTGGTVRSVFEVIPFYYSDIGMYSSTDAGLYAGTSPLVVGGFSGPDGTNITLSGGNLVTVNNASGKRYLVLGSQFFEGRGGRTQRWHGFDIDGSQENAAKAYSYYRNGSNDESGDMFTWLIDSATSSFTVEMTCYRGDGVSNGQGGANANGSTPTLGDHIMVIIELNDSAEVFRCTGSTNQNIATTGPVDVTISQVADVDFNDSASFTRASDTAINAEQDMDVLLGANISAASENVSATGRYTGFAEFTINGTEQSETFSGDYLRGNQGSTDTFGWSANLMSPLSVSSGDDLGVSATELPGSEGHAGAVHIQSGWAGFWGINLDTLKDTGGGSVIDASAALTAEATLTSGASRVREVDTAVTGEATISVDPNRIREVDSALSGNATTTIGSDRIRSVDAALTGDATISIDSSRVRGVDATLSGDATTSIDSSRVRNVDSTLSGDATTSIDSSRARNVSSILSGDATSNITPDRIRNAAVALSAEALFTATAGRVAEAAASLTGDATLTASPNRARNIGSLLSGDATLICVSSKIAGASITLLGDATLLVDGNRAREISALLQGDATMTVSASSSVDIAASLLGSASMVISGTRTREIVAALSAEASALIAADRLRVVSSTLDGTSTITGDAGAIKDIASGLLGQATMTTEADRLRTIAAALSAEATFQSSSVRFRDVSSADSGEATMIVAGILLGKIDVSASIGGSSSLSATANAIASISAQLNGEASLAGVATNLVGLKAILVSEATMVVSIELDEGVSDADIQSIVNSGIFLSPLGTTQKKSLVSSGVVLSLHSEGAIVSKLDEGIESIVMDGTIKSNTADAGIDSLLDPDPRDSNIE